MLPVQLHTIPGAGPHLGSPFPEKRRGEQEIQLGAGELPKANTSLGHVAPYKVSAARDGQPCEGQLTRAIKNTDFR